jgi:hypothetical protein
MVEIESHSQPRPLIWPASSPGEDLLASYLLRQPVPLPHATADSMVMLFEHLGIYQPDCTFEMAGRSRRLPDLVRDTRLETEFLDSLTIHSRNVFIPAARQRTTIEKVSWSRDELIGSGGFGSVWLEKRLGAPELRAVKQIHTGKKQASHLDCVHELEAIAKFSQTRVSALSLSL